MFTKSIGGTYTYSVCTVSHVCAFVFRGWGAENVGNLEAEEDADKGNEVEPNRAEERVHEQVSQTGTLVASRGSPLEVDVDVLWSPI